MIRSLVLLFVVAALAFCNAIPFMWLVNENNIHNYSDNHDHRATYDDSSLLQQVTLFPPFGVLVLNQTPLT